MKLYIKLMSGDILEYVPRSVRGNRCKIETHKPYIQRIILDHLKLNEDAYLVKILTEEDQKEIDNIYYSRMITPKSEYYMDNTTLFSFVQSIDDYEDSFFQSCESLLLKAKELYSIVQDKKEDIYDDIKDIKEELKETMWQMSYSLGIPVIIGGDFDPQINSTKKISKDPTRTVLYYTRALENCENKLRNN